MTISPTSARIPVPGRCPRIVGVAWARHGRILGYLRAPVDQPIACGVQLELIPHKRRVACPACTRHAKRYTERNVQVMRPPTTARTFTSRQKTRAQAAAFHRWFGRAA